VADSGERVGKTAALIRRPPPGGPHHGQAAITITCPAEPQIVKASDTAPSIRWRSDHGQRGTRTVGTDRKTAQSATIRKPLQDEPYACAVDPRRRLTKHRIGKAPPANLPAGATQLKPTRIRQGTTIAPRADP